MQKSSYINNAICKINAKETELKKINAMIMGLAAEANAALEAKFTEQNVDRDKLEAYQKRNLPKGEAEAETETEAKSTPEPHVTLKLHSVQLENLCNNLYKKIIMKVHPDKNNGINNDNDFIVVKEAFDKRDAYELIIVSERFAISSLEEVDNVMITLILEKKLNGLKQEINGKKNTLCYQYVVCENTACFDSYIMGFKVWCLEQENAQLREKNKVLKARLYPSTDL